MIFREKLTGRTFIFRSVKSREEHTAAVLLAAFDQSANPALVFSHFASGLSTTQIAALKKATN
jgi:predicted transcriptional regulator